MANLETTYLGLKLKNPVIVGSSGLTNSVEKIVKLRDAGAGAVVLKSLFEEQINHDVNRVLYTGQGLDYPEAMDYITSYSRNNSVSEYIQLIKDAKAAVDIPVIASINCFSADEWIDFARQIEKAGADAIELNLFVVNTDKNSDPSEYEELYYQIAKSVSEVVTIPVSMKLGLYFSSLVAVVNKLSVSGAKGVVLFNRFYEPDIDINNLTLTAAEVFSSPADIRRSLRWVAIVSDKIKNLDVAASTGVHDGDAVIKQLLAGAKAVQVCSAVYKNGPEIVTRMLNKLELWMDEKGFKSVDDFRGAMSYRKIQNPALYERAQFMRYFSKFE
ncbi:dihydroorotate dehydrogenase-like protein [Alkaliflexus imshenetskii]|jgi:dihydroorotate dehydrogenase (fumarate)|uniref:dihydroorotate dehydrogenase-like protein n=1 Tax=Alkaliflexus imshenetskii TaxID=286730 RepID=UPI00047D31E3|nr:dihydroorotate dehydrogenase-like protein [Alkaliflexus imshenetskii]